MHKIITAGLILRLRHVGVDVTSLTAAYNVQSNDAVELAPFSIMLFNGANVFGLDRAAPPLRPAYTKRRIPGLWPAFSEQRFAR